MCRGVLLAVSCLSLAAVTAAGKSTEDSNEKTDYLCGKGKPPSYVVTLHVQSDSADLNETVTYESERVTEFKEHDDCERPCYLPWPFVGKCTKLEECDFVKKRVSNIAALLHYGFNCTDNFQRDRLVCCTPKTMRGNKVTFKQDQNLEKDETYGDPETCSTLIKAGPPNPDSGCCGREKELEYSFRISSGHRTRATQFPWVVRVLTAHLDENNATVTISCAGSLITSKFVVTAAHCFYLDGALSKTTVIETAGEYYPPNRTECVPESGGREHCLRSFAAAGRATLHEHYNESSTKNDIALVKLDTDVPYTENIRPICLPTIDIDTGFYESPLYAAGWGKTSFYEDPSSTKLYTTLEHVPRDECEDYYGGEFGGSELAVVQRFTKFAGKLEPDELCAMGKDGADTCHGDSGGPIMTFDVKQRRYELAGITSYTYYYCGFNPTVYTNVFRYLPWIHRHMNN